MLARFFFPLVYAVLLALFLSLGGCATGFWRQCIDVDAKGFYSLSELGLLGIGVLRYQRNTAGCKENESSEPAKLPEVRPQAMPLITPNEWTPIPMPPIGYQGDNTLPEVKGRGDAVTKPDIFTWTPVPEMECVQQGWSTWCGKP